MAFRHAVLKVDILYDDNDVTIENMSLEDMAWELSRGQASSEYTCELNEKVSGKKMAQLAIAQGTDPEFFGIHKNGRRFL